MISGVVYFEEIVSEVKELTGITNMRPLYSRIKKAVFKAEGDIGSGGLIIRKKKNYTIGDGFYDGTIVTLPEDFHSEYSMGDLSMGVINANLLTLCNTPGPNEITLIYMGWLLDDNGNPITTRNHLEAVVALCVYRLYSSRYFLGKGNRIQYQEYKQDYNDMVLMSRGSDAFPTEAQWIDIGKTLNGGIFEAMTDCGLISCGSDGPNMQEDNETSDIEIWYFQFNDTIQPPLESVDVIESWLDTNGTLYTETDLLNGANIDQVKIGRIGFAVKTDVEDLYQIFDILGNNITTTVFTRTFDSNLGLDVYISNTIYSTGSLYFNFQN